ncbi:MAG: UDP-3-O-(3-hydroxymyristoyl)glucosamine N-acyltransferase [Planctomycetota bacterium]
MQAFLLGHLAERIGVTMVDADAASIAITGAAPLVDAKEGEITLIDDPSYLDRLKSCGASAVVTSTRFEEITIPQLVVPRVHDAFASICRLFRPSDRAISPGIHPSATVHETAAIDADCSIGPFVSVESDCIVGAGTRIDRGVTIMSGCTIGRDCQLFPGVVLYPGTILGDRVILHAGVVLGAYGFGYRMSDGKHELASQLGWVEIGDRVEIGANSCVDRGTYGVTRIGSGTKIDNLVQIGHNCRIGQHNLICSQVGIAGSASTGDYVVIAGQVGLRDHTHIGEKSMVGAQSGVANDIEPNQIVLGSPAIPRFEQAQQLAAISKLPEMRKQLRRLENQVQSLVQKKAA